MIKHRYYSAEQFDVMSKIDPLAKVRNETHDSKYGFICMDCGSVDIFSFKSLTSHNITIKGGELDLKPNDFHAPDTNEETIIPVKAWFDHQHDKGNTLVPICSRCGGSVIEKGAILDWCEEHKCLGCMYCGKVSQMAEVLLIIENCSTCMGGELSCQNNCMNKYMRKYYGIYDTVPRLLEAAEDNEKR